MLKKRILLLVSIYFLVAACGTSRRNTSSLSESIIVNDGSSPPVAIDSARPATAAPPVTAAFNELQIKYSGYLKIKPEKIDNLPLYAFIDEWMGTPYLWAGTTKKGIDCSAFMQKLLVQVYHINIPRTSIEQFFARYIERFSSKKHLSEGDLVFFKTMGENAVSHVGLYLNNRMFINASSSRGVSIASLDDPYWQTKYVAAGRVKTSMLASLNTK